MLVLKGLVLKREQTQIYVTKVLVAIISMCTLHGKILSKVTPKYFTRFTKRMLQDESRAVYNGDRSR
jgi:hypothetical protein